MELERFLKNLKLSVKDAEKGTVEAVFSTFNVKDHDGDWTLPEAFENGAPVVLSAYGHKSWQGVLPVGRGVIRVEKDKAILDGQFFLDTQLSKDTFTTIKNLIDLQEWSYGFDVLETGELTEDLRQKGVWRVLKKVKVWEVCPVLVGAGVDTETLSMKGRSSKPPATDPAIATAARGELVKFLQTQDRLRRPTA